MPQKFSGTTSSKRNTAAACLTAASIALLYASFDPAPAGETVRSASAVSSSTLVFSEEVPLPPDTKHLTIQNVSPDQLTPATEQTPAVVTVPNGCVLSNLEAIQFSALMLQDGARFLENVDTYGCMFEKQERINGDLGESQTIELKVRHSPKFSVYMKWKNGDTGRQLLYNEEYEDGQMIVKLGGLKGRLIPGIKLDPRGERAMSEARYPATEAGILGMLRQILAVRKQDIDRGQGVTCRRLANQQFDERDCMCFVYEYESKEYSEVYRKSIILIDARYHIPLMARNYTWLDKTEGLTPEQIDEQSLIENYSFSGLDFGRDFVAEEFRRDFPKYRM
ncbi:MAG: DUF1571 domain-containing protein [Planctomyces sp.]|nr:DUF1571 domain-containing protein [Planctomyces sp.]